MRSKKSASRAERDYGEALVKCPYCAGRGEVLEGAPGSVGGAPCYLCGSRGVVPEWKRASYLRSFVLHQ